MKKLLISGLVGLGLMSTSAMAGWVEGTIISVNVYPTNTSVSIKRSTGHTYARYIDPTMSDAARKELLAAVLTTYSQGATVQLGNSCSSTQYWCALKIIPTPSP